MDVEKILQQMTLEDKISLCSGADCWNTKAMEKHGIESFKMSDGPHGLRSQSGDTDMLGLNESAPATCFPAAVTATATWNTKLYAKEGEAIGLEALSNGVSIVLGPGCNIKRNPLCGRNFEYLSEDPYLAGKMSSAYIKGQQSTGVSSCLKHFAANSQEFKRMNGDSLIDQRTLREIYLSAFEIAVKEAHPDTLMCAYNKLNGIHCSDNRWLLTDLLRHEWGFDGMVVTDWGALNDRIESFKAGCDLNMPGGSAYMEKAAIEAVKSGKLSEKDVDASARRILKLMKKALENKRDVSYDTQAHHQLAGTIAWQGAVLLKNQDGVLPIKSGEAVLIGHMANDFRCQGAGSSHINPTKLESLTRAMPDCLYLACCDKNGAVTKASLRQAREAAEKANTAIVVAGMPDSFESEGYDRDNMGMPQGHISMIEAVAQANPNTVVVLLGGSPMELSWYDKVKGIIFMGLAGQAGALACADLLTGRANPCGKLTETWPLRYEDVISKENFAVRNVEYREGIYVGYRYYDKARRPVRFPFGFGLSYTSFEYSQLQIVGRTVTATVTNTGTRSGAEVVQLYIAPPEGGLFRPEKELKGFARVELQPGESGDASFELDDRSFALWHNGWKVPAGQYRVLLGASCNDIRLEGTIAVSGEEIETDSELRGSFYEKLYGVPTLQEWEKLMGSPIKVEPEEQKGSFTMDNTCLEMKKSSFIMKIMYRVIESYVSKSFGGKKDYTDPAFKMMMVSAVDCPMRSVVINAPDTINEKTARGLLAMANGRFFGGLGKMLKK